MKFILPMDEVDIINFCRKLDYHKTSRFKGIKQVEGDGRPSVYVGFDDWTHNSFQMHIWIESPKAINRTLIFECLYYPFITCDRGIAIGVTPCNNIPSLEFNRRIGFKRILTIKDGYALGTDLAIQELRREDCRWLKERVSSGRKEQYTSNA